MRTTTSLLALAVSISTISAQALQGFNYGSTNSDGSIKDQQRYADEFKVAKNLVGTSGFTSARLYTSIQGGTPNTPIAAIPAAIAEDTTLLLGIWASAGQTQIDNEIAALKNAISTYGTEFTSRVTGLSVGSEDLYRISPTGIAAKSGYGAEPQQLVEYINQVRAAFADTPLAGVPIGHVDTWNDWVNASNSAVIEAVDWIGFDAYPYFQSQMENSIDNAANLFFAAYDATVAASGGKEVWITESGWPVSGPTYNLAEANLENAKRFWDEVACKVIGSKNTYWYTLQDAYPVTPSPSFGLVGTTLSTTPLYDLSCPADGAVSSSAASIAPLPTKLVSTSAAPEATASSATDGVGLTPTKNVPGEIVSNESSSTGAPAQSTAVAPSATGLIPVIVITASTGAVPTGGPTGAAGGNSTVVTPTVSATSSTTLFPGAAATVGPMFGAAAAVMAVMVAL